MLSTPPLTRAQHEVRSEERTNELTIGGRFMPKAKPVSLHPLSFEEAIKSLIKVTPEKPKEKMRKRKKSPNVQKRAQ